VIITKKERGYRRERENQREREREREREGEREYIICITFTD
jgi:hypothetical protein